MVGSHATRLTEGDLRPGCAGEDPLPLQEPLDIFGGGAAHGPLLAVFPAATMLLLLLNLHCNGPVKACQALHITSCAKSLPFDTIELPIVMIFTAQLAR